MQFIISERCFCQIIWRKRLGDWKQSFKRFEMLITIKKSTAAEPQSSEKDWPLKITEPNPNPWILSAILPQMTLQTWKELQGLRDDCLPRATPLLDKIVKWALFACGMLPAPSTQTSHLSSSTFPMSILTLSWIIQAHLILLGFALLWFTDVAFFTNWKQDSSKKYYDLLYCAGLELNPQCLWGMSVISAKVFLNMVKISGKTSSLGSSKN